MFKCICVNISICISLTKCFCFVCATSICIIIVVVVVVLFKKITTVAAPTITKIFCYIFFYIAVVVIGL